MLAAQEYLQRVEVAFGGRWDWYVDGEHFTQAAVGARAVAQFWLTSDADLRCRPALAQWQSQFVGPFD